MDQNVQMQMTPDQILDLLKKVDESDVFAAVNVGPRVFVPFSVGPRVWEGGDA
ncbi:hypothetical protein ACMHYB_56565 [Sorangium sp. So ce1128]|uniref:Uncharacterized protein n=1 Tax=Sorangium cellulosum TaxID=56 RepID=A0A3S5GY87_SORCE|nr:hypothetical protein [Sorangium cellulosum]